MPPKKQGTYLVDIIAQKGNDSFLPRYFAVVAHGHVAGSAKWEARLNPRMYYCDNTNGTTISKTDIERLSVDEQNEIIRKERESIISRCAEYFASVAEKKYNLIIVSTTKPSESEINVSGLVKNTQGGIIRDALSPGDLKIFLGALKNKRYQIHGPQFDLLPEK